MDSAAPPPHNVLEYFEITEDDFVHIIRRDTLGEAKGATPHETSNTPSPERPAYTTTITLKHHTDEVWNLRWSHDGAYLATCGKDGRLLVWKLGVGFYSAAVDHDFVPDHMRSHEQAPVRDNATSCTTCPDTITPLLLAHGHWTTQS